MPTFDVTIEQKTYRVDIPWLSVKRMPIIVDGQPYELSVGGEDAQADRQATSGETRRAPAETRTVMAEWHASRRAE